MSANKTPRQVILQRAAAVALLIGLGLIIIPQLLTELPQDAEIQVESMEISAIPEIPEPDTSIIPEVVIEEHPDLVEPEIDPLEAVIPAGSESIALTQAEGLKAWSVRLGLYGEPKNVQQLREKLGTLDYRVYQRPLNVNGRELQLLLTGPFLTYKKAEEALKLVKSELQISDARIVDYQP